MEYWILTGLLLFIICQRFIELIIAKRNEEWMKQRGGLEVGEKHYKWFIILHTLFFLSIIVEALFGRKEIITINFFLLFIFLLAQFGRVWCIYTLGRFWNTKIIVLPKVALIKKGPYKYVKHPNYIIVGIELLLIPLLFGAIWTALIFPLLHILLLFIRIPEENAALAKSYK
ncbi:isoprenylcysteine carboxyl methyltransferase family protein [Virgibacillus sp. W0181]|uniref:isoprenylcysteine carboxyl methyltransferase family protein n=1 Tax=Virgibacillus sp. W0181 TaxID=3391581 RepID=UPI003F468FA2